jgi:hypothetical protein
VKFVACTGKAPQPHTLETMVRLQVRKTHLDLLALVAGFGELGCSHQGARCAPIRGCRCQRPCRSDRYFLASIGKGCHQDAPHGPLADGPGVRACDLSLVRAEFDKHELQRLRPILVYSLRRGGGPINHNPSDRVAVRIGADFHSFCRKGYLKPGGALPLFAYGETGIDDAAVERTIRQECKNNLGVAFLAARMGEPVGRPLTVSFGPLIRFMREAALVRALARICRYHF